jgi:C4-dicarboxylate-specific signal transduction histidine kinase
MRLKKLSVLALIILVSTLIQVNAQTTTVERYQLQLPPPPEAQPGDQEQASTTVGSMRMALYYYRIVPLLMDYSDELNDFALTLAQDTDQVKADLYQCDINRKRWKTTALISMGTTTLFILTTLIMLVW